MALVTTPGSPTADSYASLAEANTYNGNRLHATTWNVDDATKEAALRWARLLLDANPRAWTGAPSTSAQALGFPRTGMLNRNGFVIASGEIPNELKEAQSEFARQLIETDRTADNAVINQGITGIKAGSIQLNFGGLETGNSNLVARSVREMDAMAAILPDAVKYILPDSWLLPDEEDENNSDLLVEVL